MELDEALSEHLYISCLAAVKALGEDVSGMSWFASNWDFPSIPEEKEAA